MKSALHLIGLHPLLLPLNKLITYAFFHTDTLSICRDNLFLSSYMACTVHFVGNPLLTKWLFASSNMIYARGRQGIETSSFLERKIGHTIQRGIVTFLIWH